MSHPSSLTGVFAQPFAEQVAFFRRKLRRLVPTRRWDDMVREAHDDGFMVAGATEADLLTDLAAAVDKAIAEGRGIEEFRRDFRDVVRRNGWTGWTGEGSVKGEAWRVGVILRTNAYTSYSAGRHAQLLDGDFKYWVYRHGGSREPRLQHLSWNGLALPPDHEFWTTHYPPSDWGCSCYVVGARSDRAVVRLGGDLAKTLPGDWRRRDPKTGAPIGIGKGWDYAPGASVSPLVRAMAGKIGSWDHRVAKAFMDALPADRAEALSQAYRALPSTADDARRYAQQVFAGTAEGAADMRPLPPVRTMGLVPPSQAERIRALTDIDVTGYDFTLDRSGAGHVKGEHGPGNEVNKRQRPVLAEDFARLPAILSSPDRIVPSDRPTDMGETILDYVKSIGGEEWHVLVAVRGTKRRTLVLKTMYIKAGGR